MAEIIWTQKAKKQLESAVKYIRDAQGVYYAEIVLNGILKEVEILANFPELGQKEPLLETKTFEYRYLVKWSYKIIYRKNKSGDKVYIVRVFHTSQNPNKLWKAP